MAHTDAHYEGLADRFLAELQAAEILAGRSHLGDRHTLWPEGLAMFIEQLSRNGITLSVHITK